METLLVQEAVPHYGLQAVNRFQALMGTRHETKFMSHCIDSIREFVDRWEHFKVNTTIAKQFLDELTTLLHKCRPEEGAPDEYLEDCTFAIVECLANIFREDHLKQPTRQPAPAQANLMRLFEEHDEWNKGDGKVVTDYYYFVIPDAVNRENSAQ